MPTINLYVQVHFPNFVNGFNLSWWQRIAENLPYQITCAHTGRLCVGFVHKGEHRTPTSEHRDFRWVFRFMVFHHFKQNFYIVYHSSGSQFRCSFGNYTLTEPSTPNYIRPLTHICALQQWENPLWSGWFVHYLCIYLYIPCWWNICLSRKATHFLAMPMRIQLIDRFGFNDCGKPYPHTMLRFTHHTQGIRLCGWCLLIDSLYHHWICVQPNW